MIDFCRLAALSGYRKIASHVFYQLEPTGLVWDGRDVARFVAGEIERIGIASAHELAKQLEALDASARRENVIVTDFSQAERLAGSEVVEGSPT